MNNTVCSACGAKLGIAPSAMYKRNKSGSIFRNLLVVGLVVFGFYYFLNNFDTVSKHANLTPNSQLRIPDKKIEKVIPAIPQPSPSPFSSVLVQKPENPTRGKNSEIPISNSNSLRSIGSDARILSNPSDWKQDENWVIYSSKEQSGCFAEKDNPNGDVLLLGTAGQNRDFVVGLKTGKGDWLQGLFPATIPISFDGNKERLSYFRHIKDQGREIVVGRYMSNASLTEHIARSNSISIVYGKDSKATFKLDGSRNTIKSLMECYDSQNYKFASASRQPGYPLPTDTFCDYRPTNGRMLKQNAKGLGNAGHHISVKNGSGGDAIVIVRDSGTRKLVYSFFVHDAQSATVKGISDGRYLVQFAHGETLDASCKMFVSPTPSEMDKQLDFVTRIEKTAKQSTTYTHRSEFTLYSVVGGNTNITSIPESEFRKD
jgi:hypothetical protein